MVKSKTKTRLPAKREIKDLIEIPSVDLISPSTKILDILNAYSSEDKKSVTELVCNVLIEGLNAKKSVVTKDGDIYELDDYDVRLKYAEAILDIKGEKTLPESGGQKIPNIVIVLPTGERL